MPYEIGGAGHRLPWPAERQTTENDRLPHQDKLQDFRRTTLAVLTNTALLAVKSEDLLSVPMVPFGGITGLRRDQRRQQEKH